MLRRSDNVGQEHTARVRFGTDIVAYYRPRITMTGPGIGVELVR